MGKLSRYQNSIRTLLVVTLLSAIAVFIFFTKQTKPAFEIDKDVVVLRAYTVEHKPFDIQEVRGEVIVVHFWKTWRVDEFEELVRIDQKYNDVVIVSCNIGEESKKFQAYYAKNRSKMEWTHLHAPDISEEPMVFLIDGQGRLVETGIALGDLEREVVRERRSSSCLL